MAEPSVFDTPFVPDPNHYYIPCKVEPGLFKGEWLVTFEANDLKHPGQTIQAQSFVDERSVNKLEGTPARAHPVNGRLRVSWAGADNDVAKLILPQPAVPVGTRIFVPENVVEVEAA